MEEKERKTLPEKPFEQKSLLGLVGSMELSSWGRGEWAQWGWAGVGLDDLRGLFETERFCGSADLC